MGIVTTTVLLTMVGGNSFENAMNEIVAYDVLLTAKRPEAVRRGGLWRLVHCLTNNACLARRTICGRVNV